MRCTKCSVKSYFKNTEIIILIFESSAALSNETKEYCTLLFIADTKHFPGDNTERTSHTLFMIIYIYVYICIVWFNMRVYEVYLG